MKRLAWYTLLIVGTVLAGLALWQMQEAVTTLLIALAVAAGLTPTIRILQARGWRRGAALGATFGVALLLLIGMLGVFGTLVYTESALVVERLPGWYDAKLQELQALGGTGEMIAAQLPASQALAEALATRQISDLGAFLFGLVNYLLTLATLIIGVASLVYYWLDDQQRIERLWLSLLSLDARVRARGIWTQVYDEVGLYVRAETVMVTVTGLTLLALYKLIGLPGAGTLAALGGIAQIVPVLNAPIALVPAVLVGMTQGWTTGILTFVAVTVTLIVVRWVLAPRLFAESTTTNPTLIVFLLMALAEVGGFWLTLLAPPLAAAIQATTRVLTSARTATVVEESDEIAALRTRLRDLEATLEAEESPTPQLRGMVGRTRQLLEEITSEPQVRAVAGD